MNGKFTKYLAYAFFICLILIFVLGSANPDLTWVQPVRTVAFSIAMVCGLIYVCIIIYCIIDNKKIDKYLNEDKYDELITYATKKANKKAVFLGGRKTYYEYLLLTCYLAKDEKELIDEYFEKLKGQELMFPMISYWKVCYKFASLDYSELKENYEAYKNHRDILKSPNKYGLLVELLSAFVLYSEGKINEAKDIVDKLDTSSISMPSTKKAIEIINNTARVEEVIEETKGTEELINNEDIGE